MSATTSPGLRRSFAITSETFGFLAGTSILWMYWSAGKLREAGAFVEAGGGEDQKSAADNRREGSQSHRLENVTQSSEAKASGDWIAAVGRRLNNGGLRLDWRPGLANTASSRK
jgi:hypothetical protein